MQVKKQILIVLLALVPVTFIHASPENPNVSSSFQSNTTVPSEGQSRRLLTSSNQSIASGNDVVTGNVGGMGYFHGVVPYGSSYYSSANLNDPGSNNVTSFLRRSTSPIFSDRNPGQRQSFFQPQRAVSSYGRTTQPLSNSSLTSMTGQTASRSSALSNLPNISLADEQQRPLSSNSQELEQILSRQLQLRQAAEEDADRELLKDKSVFKDFFETVLEPQKPEADNDQKAKDTEQEPLTPEERVLKDIQQEIPDAILEQDPLDAQDESEKTDAAPSEKDLFGTLDKLKNPDAASSEQDSQQSDQIPSDSLDTAVKISLHDEAEYIRGEHKTFKSLAEAKFSDYMKAAEEFIRDGKFYKAADTYALASVWKSEDARAYAGQSFSLFAAGEYMSSAYYLSRAIEINPALAAKKYDLAALIGNRDVFETRLIEITTWQQSSDSGELAFLMAYIYCQEGKLPQAAAAITNAEEKMPDNKAVLILKRVIIPETNT